MKTTEIQLISESSIELLPPLLKLIYDTNAISSTSTTVMYHSISFCEHHPTVLLLKFAHFIADMFVSEKSKLLDTNLLQR